MSSDENSILKEELRGYRVEEEERGEFGRELEEGGKEDTVVMNSLAFDDGKI